MFWPCRLDYWQFPLVLTYSGDHGTYQLESSVIVLDQATIIMVHSIMLRGDCICQYLGFTDLFGINFCVFSHNKNQSVGVVQI